MAGLHVAGADGIEPGDREIGTGLAAAEDVDSPSTASIQQQRAGLEV